LLILPAANCFPLGLAVRRVADTGDVGYRPIACRDAEALGWSLKHAGVSNFFW